MILNSSEAKYNEEKYIYFKVKLIVGFEVIFF
jgi:hypothetical protein